MMQCRAAGKLQFQSTFQITFVLSTHPFHVKVYQSLTDINGICKTLSILTIFSHTASCEKLIALLNCTFFSKKDKSESLGGY